jgi:hypothetical protein
MLLQPKNWAHFQHYKDRCPPWIKLHRDLLNNRDFMRLPLASKALAPLLWLLASESKDGAFDGSLDELVFRLHISEKDYHDGLKPLLDKGFFISDDVMLAPRLQDAIPEREGETETKTEKKAAKAAATVVACPSDVDKQVWDDWVSLRKAKSAKVTQTAVDGARTEATKAGMSLEDFFRVWCLRGSQGLMAEWLKPDERKAMTNKFDVAHTTTPPPPNQDAALKKIAEDRKKAVPMPADIKAKMAELTKGMKA